MSLKVLKSLSESKSESKNKKRLNPRETPVLRQTDQY